jgi:hypothetical protein
MYQSPQSDYSGVVLCVAIFLILMLLFRGVQNRRNCVVYAQDDDLPATSYVEIPPAPKKRKRELGGPTMASSFSLY